MSLIFKKAPPQYTDQCTGLSVPVKIRLGSYTPVPEKLKRMTKLLIIELETVPTTARPSNEE